MCKNNQSNDERPTG